MSTTKEHPTARGDIRSHSTGSTRQLRKIILVERFSNAYALDSMSRMILLVTVFLLTVSEIVNGADICKAAITGPGRASSLCDTPYCVCTEPYGRVYCSCIPKNSTYPRGTEVIIRSNSPCKVNSEVRDLIIENCANVTFPENEISGLPLLQSIEITNVKELSLNKHSFSWNTSTNGLRIQIKNVTIANLPSYVFHGNIEKIHFENVYLGQINAYAFSSIINTWSIKFINCDFANIVPQSFKKFSTTDFLIQKCRFNTIPSRFIFEIHVRNHFEIDLCTIESIKTLAFHIAHPAAVIINECKINTIEGEAFKIESKGKVTITKNYFENIQPGAFKGISRSKDIATMGRGKLLFDGNVLESITKDALSFNTTAYDVMFSNVAVNAICECESIIDWRDVIYPHRKTLIATQAELEQFQCYQKSSKEKERNFDFVSAYEYYQDHCIALLSSVQVLIIIIVSTALGLCVAIIILICCFKRQRHRWDTVPTTDDKDVTQKKPIQPKGLVVPDTRVYRETEFHVVEEKVVPMDEVIPYRVTKDRSRDMFVRETVN